jgi:hypothetical protein
MTNLFEQFEGADLDRLAECFKAIKKAGLKTDKYTQAGVNQSSGNVWVWSEDWQGCVYCSIGFDVAWTWSCPNCGEEYEAETYGELCDLIGEQEELSDQEGCEHCRPKETLNLGEMVAAWEEDNA